ncbi:hypothetical protein C8J57DRAFT_1212060 [Mycena rebaudengoi]|nr:hypothetical protein C8J57DRAFT_1212060 [Mycena rebaudengoi]
MDVKKFGTKSISRHPENAQITRISLQRHKWGVLGEIFAFLRSWERKITIFRRLGYVLSGQKLGKLGQSGPSLQRECKGFYETSAADIADFSFLGVRIGVDHAGVRNVAAPENFLDCWHGIYKRSSSRTGAIIHALNHCILVVLTHRRRRPTFHDRFIGVKTSGGLAMEMAEVVMRFTEGGVQEEHGAQAPISSILHAVCILRRPLRKPGQAEEHIVLAPGACELYLDQCAGRSIVEIVTLTWLNESSNLSGGLRVILSEVISQIRSTQGNRHHCVLKKWLFCPPDAYRNDQVPRIRSTAVGRASTDAMSAQFG